jgi:hypothetical protein
VDSAGTIETDFPAAAAAPPRLRTLRILEWSVGFYATLLIVFSIGLFMMRSTTDTVGQLITAQNLASLKLWQNLDYFDRHRAADPATDTSLPPGLFDSLVEFSRTNASIMKNVHRLSPLRVFAGTAPLDTILSTRLTATDGTRAHFDHIGVDPQTDGSNVVKQGMYQIELYQAIRDYAQDQSAFYKDCLGAVSAYLMPVFYALLGAALWSFRSSCQKIAAGEEPAPDRCSRFVMAAIAGIAISVLSNLLPTDLALSPLAMAFVCGYAIETFTLRLDAAIAGIAKKG